MQNLSRQASLSITNSRSSLKLMSIESAMPSSRLILCVPHMDVGHKEGRGAWIALTTATK